MTEFRMVGPVEINTVPLGRIYQVDKADRRPFWERARKLEPGLPEKVGCYVFVVRTPRDDVPWYVGRTINSFEDERFQDHKMRKYLEALSHYTRQFQTCFFFLISTQKRGRVSSDAIDALEDLLIANAYDENHDLTNIRGVSEEEHSIRHVYNSGVRGARNPAERFFAKVMGFD